jgi:hypothetical protein
MDSSPLKPFHPKSQDLRINPRAIIIISGILSRLAALFITNRSRLGFNDGFNLNGGYIYSA